MSVQKRSSNEITYLKNGRDIQRFFDLRQISRRICKYFVHQIYEFTFHLALAKDGLSIKSTHVRPR